MVTHQLQVRFRPVKVRRSETDVLPLSHPTTGELCHCGYVCVYVSVCLSVCLSVWVCVSLDDCVHHSHHPSLIDSSSQLTSTNSFYFDTAYKSYSCYRCRNHTADCLYPPHCRRLIHYILGILHCGHVMCRSDALLLLPAMHTVLSAIQPISQSHADMPNANWIREKNILSCCFNFFCIKSWKKFNCSTRLEKIQLQY